MTTEAVPERKWQMKKIGAQDWVLLGNDDTTLWRFTTYIDGRCDGLESGPWEQTFWQVWRWKGSPRDEIAIADSIVDRDWSMWESEAEACTTRREAISEAMRLEHGRRKP